MIELRNSTNLEFTNISSELFREYRFPRGGVVRIESPLYLNVSVTGGHRILDGNGLSHYIHPGWFEIIWKAREGSPHFVK